MIYAFRIKEGLSSSITLKFSNNTDVTLSSDMQTQIKNAIPNKPNVRVKITCFGTTIDIASKRQTAVVNYLNTLKPTISSVSARKFDTNDTSKVNNLRIVFSY